MRDLTKEINKFWLRHMTHLHEITSKLVITNKLNYKSLKQW